MNLSDMLSQSSSDELCASLTGNVLAWYDQMLSWRFLGLASVKHRESQCFVQSRGILIPSRHPIAVLNFTGHWSQRTHRHNVFPCLELWRY